MNQLNRSCPVCRSQKISFKEHFKCYDIYECQSCTLEFSSPMKAMSVKEYESAEGYNKLRLLGGNNQESVLWWGHKQFLSDAHKYFPKMSSAKLLDIGCGTGAFVDFALRKGYDAYGVDFDEASVQVARGTAQLKERVFHGDTRDIHKCVGFSKFEVVTFFEVLEHVDDIHFFMDQVRALLVPNGFIGLYVPLANRWSLKVQEREAADYPPNHLTRWTEKALKVLMKETGFDIIKSYELPISFGLYRFVSRIFNKNICAVNPIPVATPVSSGLSVANKCFDFAVRVKQTIQTSIFSAMGLRGDRMLIIARKM